mgnify:CR=1 FL=1
MMNETKFDTTKFNYHGGYLTYGQYFTTDEKFVARFKYAAQRRRKNAFVKFLVANFTPQEYFSRREAGETPLDILQSKGYSERAI